MTNSIPNGEVSKIISFVKGREMNGKDARVRNNIRKLWISLLWKKNIFFYLIFFLEMSPFLKLFFGQTEKFSGIGTRNWTLSTIFSNTDFSRCYQSVRVTVKKKIVSFSSHTNISHLVQVISIFFHIIYWFLIFSEKRIGCKTLVRQTRVRLCSVPYLYFRGKFLNTIHN